VAEEALLEVEPDALDGVEFFSDPQRRAYQALGLSRATAAQIFHPRVFVHGMMALLKGHIVGKLQGDGFQMPGAFLIRDGKVIREFRHKTVSDRVEYCDLTPGAAHA